MLEQSTIEPIFASETAKVEPNDLQIRSFLEERINIGGKAPALPNAGLAEQSQARHGLKLIQGSQVRIKDSAVFSIRVRQEPAITKRKGRLAAAPKAFPWELFGHTELAFQSYRHGYSTGEKRAKQLLG